MGSQSWLRITCQCRGHRRFHMLQGSKCPRHNCRAPTRWSPRSATRGATSRSSRSSTRKRGPCSPHVEKVHVQRQRSQHSPKYMTLKIIMISCLFSGLSWEPTQAHRSGHLKLDITVPGEDLLMLAHPVLPTRSFRGLPWMDLLSLLPASGTMLLCTSCAPRMGGIAGPPGKYWQQPSLKDTLLRAPFKREPAPKCTPLGSTATFEPVLYSPQVGPATSTTGMLLILRQTLMHVPEPPEITALVSTVLEIFPWTCL